MTAGTATILRHQLTADPRIETQHMTTTHTIQATLTRECVEWENWLFSPGIAEALFASWAHDKNADSNVRWITSRQSWDVVSDDFSVDVKDSFITHARQAPNGLVECVGFQGTSRGPGAEARDTVTHYALVVRALTEGIDTTRVAADGTVTITASGACRIYLIPRDIVNTFRPQSTLSGEDSKGHNRVLPLAQAEQYLVFDSRPPAAVAHSLLHTLTGIGLEAWNNEPGLRSDSIEAVVVALASRWDAPVTNRLLDIAIGAYDSVSSRKHFDNVAEIARAVAFEAATGEDRQTLAPLMEASTDQQH